MTLDESPNDGTIKENLTVRMSTAVQDDAGLKLFVVKDYDRWGYSLNIVRAASEEEAKSAVAPNSKSFHIEELREGPGILWCYDHSPDTPR